MGLPLVGEELRCGEREPGREDPLHRGVGGEVEEEDGPLERARFLELADEVERRNPDRARNRRYRDRCLRRVAEQLARDAQAV